MELTSKAIRRTLFHLRAWLFGIDPARKYAGDEPPLRSELFSADQMEQHGKALAGSHKVSRTRSGPTLKTAGRQ